MFWGLVLKTNKRYSQCVTKGFHVSNATLEVNTVEGKDAIVQVWVHTDDSDHLLCNLSKHIPQVPLELAFTEGETVAFYSKGAGTVHLNGYILPEDEFDYNEMGDEEAEDIDDEDMQEFKKAMALKKPKKGAKAIEADSDDSDESDDDDFEEDENEIDDDLDGEEEADSDEEDDEDDEEDDDDDDDDDSDEEDEEEVAAPPAKQAKLDKSKQNGLTNGKPAQKENKQKEQQQQKKSKQQEQQQQQQKTDKNQPQKPVKKVLKGGTIIEDLRVGKGPEATIGKRVGVYYEGRLQSTNKVFDSSKAGDGFTFQLGRKEVISAWDIGIAGMRVGGKRRIVCPPSVAYGAKGAPPRIPPNATLVFEVELKSA